MNLNDFFQIILNGRLCSSADRRPPQGAKQLRRLQRKRNCGTADPGRHEVTAGGPPKFLILLLLRARTLRLSAILWGWGLRLALRLCVLTKMTALLLRDRSRALKAALSRWTAVSSVPESAWTLPARRILWI